ncbi:aspartate/glutamate racemase family protein [Streptomyces sp. DSM 41982]|uniref:Aspartate/glutamate racemase family protein n=3 Tax=Streptomyces TaxID=1883 RepID=A0ABD5E3K5_9ACTN|nr:aspartate/glutamate racemase family protein [Streptomyces sp. DSM 41982]MDT0415187.1 aspartate/glutamate racemase family protein [Streptomyces sp. DSM 41982]
MKIALLDSGIGLLPAAAAVRGLRPDADLVLSSDPASMPWGPRTSEDITRLALGAAEAAAALEPDALVIACNTASTHALPALRARFEDTFPVIGTVPAIKPAAAFGAPVAIWATPATTGSEYQRRLIAEFAPGGNVTAVACPGLADAVQHADEAATEAAIADAAARTPAGVRVVVLGCTHYELVGARIAAALTRPGGAAPTLLGSAPAVAAQALRRAAGGPPDLTRTGELTVLLGGVEEPLPREALAYAEGRLLAGVGAAR